MKRPPADSHVSILTGLVLVFYVGELAAPSAVTADLLKLALGGLLTLLVTQPSASPPA